MFDNLIRVPMRIQVLQSEPRHILCRVDGDSVAYTTCLVADQLASIAVNDVGHECPEAVEQSQVNGRHGGRR